MPGCATSRSWPEGLTPHRTVAGRAGDGDGRFGTPGDPPGAPAPARAPGRLQVLRPVPPASGWCPRSWCWPSARSSWPSWPATGPGPGRSCGPGVGTSAASAPSGASASSSRATAGSATRRSACSRWRAAPASPPTAGVSSSSGSTAPTPTSWRQPKRRRAGAVPLPRRPAAPRRPGAGRRRRRSPAPVPGPPRSGRSPGRSGRGRSSGRTRLTVWLAAALVVVIGTRGVIGARLPAVGQFVPFPSWSPTFGPVLRRLAPLGRGDDAPASPALALAGVVGTVLLGAMGLTQKVLIFACIPLGVWGVVRLLRPFGSQRASLVAGLAYLAMALPYNALALGRWGALVVYAGVAVGAGPAVPGHRAPPPYGRLGPAGRAVAGLRGAGFRDGRRPRALLEAVLVSFVPAAAVVVVVAALALLLSSARLRRVAGHPAGRLAGRSGSTAVAAVICLPVADRRAVRRPGGGRRLRCAHPGVGSGVVGHRCSASPSARSESRRWPGGSRLPPWCPLLLARGDRFRWAGRCWSIALVFWFARLGHRPGVDRQPGHRSVGAAGPGRRRRRRRHRAGHRRLRGGPAGRRLRMAAAGHGGGRRRGGRWAPSRRCSRPSRADGTSRQRLQPVGDLDERPRRPAGRSGCCGWATPAPQPGVVERGRRPGLRHLRGRQPRRHAGCGTRPAPGPAPGWPRR